MAVSENSGRVRSWSSLDGSPSIHRPMVTKRDANSSLLALHADSIVACCEKSCTAKIHDLARDASAYSSSDIEENVIMDLRTSKESETRTRDGTFRSKVKVKFSARLALVKKRFGTPSFGLGQP